MPIKDKFDKIIKESKNDSPKKVIKKVIRKKSEEDTTENKDIQMPIEKKIDDHEIDDFDIKLNNTIKNLKRTVIFIGGGASNIFINVLKKLSKDEYKEMNLTNTSFLLLDTSVPTLNTFFKQVYNNNDCQYFNRFVSKPGRVTEEIIENESVISSAQNELVSIDEENSNLLIIRFMSGSSKEIKGVKDFVGGISDIETPGAWRDPSVGLSKFEETIELGEGTYLKIINKRKNRIIIVKTMGGGTGSGGTHKILDMVKPRKNDIKDICVIEILPSGWVDNVLELCNGINSIENEKSKSYYSNSNMWFIFLDNAILNSSPYYKKLKLYLKNQKKEDTEITDVDEKSNKSNESDLVDYELYQIVNEVGSTLVLNVANVIQRSKRMNLIFGSSSKIFFPFVWPFLPEKIDYCDTKRFSVNVNNLIDIDRDKIVLKSVIGFMSLSLDSGSPKNIRHFIDVSNEDLSSVNKHGVVYDSNIMSYLIFLYGYKKEIGKESDALMDLLYHRINRIGGPYLKNEIIDKFYSNIKDY